MVLFQFQYRIGNEAPLLCRVGTRPIYCSPTPGPIPNNQRTMAVPPQRLKDLVKLPVAAEWKHLGLRLDVPLYKLNEIQANHEHSPNFTQDCLSDMFDWWLDNSNDTTYESLACGIRDIGETKLVTCFLQQPSHGEEVYSKLAHALNRIRERDSDCESKHR